VVHVRIFRVISYTIYAIMHVKFGSPVEGRGHVSCFADLIPLIGKSREYQEKQEVDYKRGRHHNKALPL
jgi:hypothetical protein